MPLALVAVHRPGGKPFCFQRILQLFGAVLRARKDQRGLLAVRVQMGLQKRAFLGLMHKMHVLVDPVHRFARRGHLHADRVRQVAFGDLRHLLGHGGGKQHGLAGVGQEFGDAAQVVDKAEVQHLVRLVQHQEPRLGQRHRAPVDQVEQAARGGDNDVRAACQTVDLPANARAAGDDADLDRRALRVTAQVFDDLLGQFARGREHQPGDAFLRGAFLLAHQGGNQRQAKGGGLAGAGLRQPHHIAAVHGMRDGLGLDRGGGGDVLVREIGQKTGRQPQHVKVQKAFLQAPRITRRRKIPLTRPEKGQARKGPRTRTTGLVPVDCRG